MTDRNSNEECAEARSEQPLEGVLVLDLSRVLAGPWCTQTLADLGATVVKIERPGVGDDTRQWGPPFLSTANGTSRGEAAYYLAANRGKYSVEVDISRPEGQALVSRIASKADVLVENFKTGDLVRYGLDYSSLRQKNPRLIYASITGFGQTGPDRSRAGYDLIIQAMSGLMSITGRPDGEEGDGPVKVGVAVSDLFSGLYATIGILGALRERDRSGLGQHVDVALMDSQVATLANQAMNYLVGGVVPPRLGNAHPNIVPYQAFETSDGEMVVAVGNDSQFRAFCKELGLDSLPDESRFSTNAMRVANRNELVELIAGCLRSAPTDSWVAKLDSVNVPCGPIRSLDRVFDPDRPGVDRLTVGIERDDGTVVPGLANPIRFSRTPVQYAKSPPQLGEDTRRVLREIVGLGDGEIETLASAGIVSARRSSSGSEN